MNNVSISNDKVRVNLSLSRSQKDVLDMLAERDSLTATTKATLLLQKALEIEEDVALEKLALERSNSEVEYIQHDKFWKEIMAD